MNYLVTYFVQLYPYSKNDCSKCSYNIKHELIIPFLKHALGNAHLTSVNGIHV